MDTSLDSNIFWFGISLCDWVSGILFYPLQLWLKHIIRIVSWLLHFHAMRSELLLSSFAGELKNLNFKLYIEDLWWCIILFCWLDTWFEGFLRDNKYQYIIIVDQSCILPKRRLKLLLLSQLVIVFGCLVIDLFILFNLLVYRLSSLLLEIRLWFYRSHRFEVAWIHFNRYFI